MTALTLRGLCARKLRAGLTALAVLLGVMMISGTYVFTDTINHSFDRIFETANEGVDIKVVPHKTVDSAGRRAAAVQRVAAGAGQVGAGRREVAAGSVNDTATIFDEQRQAREQGRRAAAAVLRLAQAVQPAHLRPRDGRPRTPNEVDDRHRAPPTRSDFKVGDTVLVGGQGAGEALPDLGARASSATCPRSAARRSPSSTLPEAQRISREARQARRDRRRASPRARTPRTVAAELRRALPRTVDVKTGAQDAQDQADDIQSGLSFLNTLLLAFAGIALFVGAFIIFNTFSITVAQRTTEFGLLRTMGASRRQILRSVLLEALIIGLGASIVGLFAGILAAKGISALFKAFSIDLPSQGTVLLTAHGDRLAAGRDDRDDGREPRRRRAARPACRRSPRCARTSRRRGRAEPPPHGSCRRSLTGHRRRCCSRSACSAAQRRRRACSA